MRFLVDHLLDEVFVVAGTLQPIDGRFLKKAIQTALLGLGYDELEHAPAARFVRGQHRGVVLDALQQQIQLQLRALVQGQLVLQLRIVRRGD
ncbi:hypothetical protein CAL14_01360 [Bordetella genomosp. 9]|nr:hypothetical protein CAL14_01360 [Bordetella genomosp. 9]